MKTASGFASMVRHAQAGGKFHLCWEDGSPVASGATLLKAAEAIDQGALCFLEEIQVAHRPNNGTVIQSPLGKHVWEGGKWTCECYESHAHECPNYNPRSYLSL